MPRWDDTLISIETTVWDVLHTAADDLGASSRLCAFATNSQMGGPEVRQVVLRAADREARQVVIHTDASSTKMLELRADARASVLVWEAERQLQIRLKGMVEIALGSKVQDVWGALPETSLVNYGVTPAPGTPIPAFDAFERRPDPERLAVLTLHVAEIDAVVLAPDVHRRALFRRADDWSGQWLAP